MAALTSAQRKYVKEKLYPDNRYIFALQKTPKNSPAYIEAIKIGEKYKKEFVKRPNGIVQNALDGSFPTIDELIFWKYMGRRFDLFFNLENTKKEQEKSANAYFDKMRGRTLDNDEKRMQRAFRNKNFH